MKTKENVRTKKYRVIVAAVLAVVALLMMALLPQFKEATYELENNVLKVERENLLNKSVLVDLILADEQGNLTEREVRVNYAGDETMYEYDEAYFQKLLETDGNVYIKGISERWLPMFSYFEIQVGVSITILFVVFVLSAMYLLFQLEKKLH